MTPLARAFALALVIFIAVAAYMFYICQKNAANSFYVVNPYYADSENGNTVMLFVGKPAGPQAKITLSKLVGKNVTVNSKNNGMIKGKVSAALLSDASKASAVTPAGSIILGIALNKPLAAQYVFDPSDCATVIA